MSPAVIEVEGLTITYRGAAPAVSNVSLHIARGEFVALVGESGSGKSSLSRSLIGLLPEGATCRADSFRFQGERRTDLTAPGLRDLPGRQIGFVPQDPFTSLDPIRTIGSQVVEILTALRGLDARTANDEAITLLETAGIAGAASRLDRYPHEFSGGMCQRVLIALALACTPPLVVADEPTSGLDVTVQRVILDEIGALRRRTKTAILFVTHDLGVALDRADRLAVMHQGRIVEQGTPREILHAPKNDYTRRLLDAVPMLSTARRIGGVRPVAAPASPPPAVLRASHLTVRYPGAPVPGLDRVSLTLRQGRTLGVIGESGSGKTTLARVLAGLRPLDAGEIQWLPTPGAPASAPPVQLVFQSPASSFNPRWRIGRSLLEPLVVSRVPPAERRRRVLEQLAAVSLDDVHLERFPHQLSGGQMQRAAIARALVLGPRTLILDEPVSALDVLIQDRILRLLAELQDRHGLSYVFITHDLGVARIIADEIMVMRHGGVVEHGPAETVFAMPSHPYTRALIEAAPGQRALQSKPGGADMARVMP